MTLEQIAAGLVIAYAASAVLAVIVGLAWVIFTARTRDADSPDR